MITITPLKLNGTFEISYSPIKDVRGYFLTTYQAKLFEERGMVTDWVQENQSLSKRKGVIRGLHFQLPPHAETKLVRVLSGAVWDVFVDLRKDSPTFGQWDCIELSADNLKMVYIPKGFAHGFCTLTENVLIGYKVDAYFEPSAQAGLLWNDPDFGIEWPLDGEPQLSDKDHNLPPLSAFDSPF